MSVLAPRRRRTLLEPTTIARWLGVQYPTVLRWIRRGDLAALNVGTRTVPYYRVFPRDLADFLRRRGASEASIRHLLAGVDGATLR